MANDTPLIDLVIDKCNRANFHLMNLLDRLQKLDNWRDNINAGLIGEIIDDYRTFNEQTARNNFLIKLRKTRKLEAVIFVFKAAYSCMGCQKLVQAIRQTLTDCAENTAYPQSIKAAELLEEISTMQYENPAVPSIPTGQECIDKSSYHMFGTWPSIKSFDIPGYFQRNVERDFRDQLRDATNNANRKCDYRCWLIHGEGGVGKSTTVGAVMSDVRFIKRECLIDVTIWLNMTEVVAESKDIDGHRIEALNDDMFEKMLSAALNSVTSSGNLSTSLSIKSLQDYSGRLAIVFDDIYDIRLYGKIQKLLYKFFPSGTLVIFVSRLLDSDKDFFNWVKYVKLEPWNEQEMKDMMRQVIGDQFTSSPDQLELIAKHCVGLPLVSNFVCSMLRVRGASFTKEAVTLLTSSPMDAINLDVQNIMTGKQEIMKQLMRGIIKIDDKTLLTYYACLVIMFESQFSKSEAAIVCNVSMQDTDSFLENLCRSSLVRRNNDDSFTIHALWRRAALGVFSEEDFARQLFGGAEIPTEFAEILKQYNKVEDHSHHSYYAHMLQLRSKLVNLRLAVGNKSVVSDCLKLSCWSLLRRFVGICNLELFRGQIPANFGDFFADMIESSELRTLCVLCDALLTACPDVNLTAHLNVNMVIGCDEQTLVMIATKYRCFQFVKYLQTSCEAAILERKDNNGNTALHLAVSANDTKIVEFLLSIGSNIEAVNAKKRTPLAIAIANDNAQIAQLLVNNSANVEVDFDPDVTILYEAASFCGWDMIGALLKGEPEILRRDGAGWTALHAAASTGKALNLQAMLDHIKNAQGAEELKKAIETKTNAKFTPLIVAIRFGYIDVARALIRKGAEVEVTDCDGKSALLLSHLYDRVEIAAELLNKKVNVETIYNKALADKHIKFYPDVIYDPSSFLQKVELCRNQKLLRKPLQRIEHKSPLWIATASGDVVELRQLLAEAEIQNKDILICKDLRGRTLLHEASALGYVDVVHYLIQAGMGVREPSGDEDHRWLGIHFAAFYGHLDVVERYLSKDVLLANERDQIGDAVIHLAARRGHDAIIRRLVEIVGSQVTKDIGYLKRTPLHAAAARGHENAVAVLMNLGAEPDHYDANGMMPIHTAIYFGWLNVVKLFLKRIPSLQLVRTTHGYSLLERSAYRGRCEIIHYLLYEVKVSFEKRALLLAGENGYPDAVNMLLSFLETPESNVTQEQRTDAINDLLQVATNRGHQTIVELARKRQNLLA